MTEASVEPRLYRHWLLRLVPGFAGGGWLSGALLFGATFSLYQTISDPRYINTYSVMFLSGMVAYMIPIHALIVARSEQALDTLRPLMSLTAAQFEQRRMQLSHQSLRAHLWMSGVGLLLGLGHMLILEYGRTGTPATILSSGTAAVSAFGTVFIWLVMTNVISIIVNNAVIFYRLGRDHLRISLLHAHELVPLASVSVISTLSLIGAQALFGLLALDGDSNWITMLPGFLGTAVPMVPMFLLPVWAVHKRLQRLKSDALDAINQGLASYRGDSGRLPHNNADLGELNQLLAYRREIQSVPEWPFDLGAMSRLGLYLIIPPLTWIGAALIENLVDALL